MWLRLARVMHMPVVAQASTMVLRSLQTDQFEVRVPSRTRTVGGKAHFPFLRGSLQTRCRTVLHAPWPTGTNVGPPLGREWLQLVKARRSLLFDLHFCS